MTTQQTAYERAVAAVPRFSQACIDHTDMLQQPDAQSPLWELAWAVLHELDLHEEGEDDYAYVDAPAWRAWLAEFAPTDFPQDWRR